MRGARVVLRKELAEILANPMLLASLSSLPAVMVAVTLGVLWTHVAGANEASVVALARWYAPSAPPGAAAAVLIEATVRNSLGLFLVMPVFLPVIIASQSVAGEKERRTLEPLLATPLTAFDLVLGKTLAAAAPALAITFVAFGVFAAGADLVAWPVLRRAILPNAAFLFSVLILAPLLSFFGTCLSVLISARVGDARLAQSLAGLLVMPFFAAVALQFGGLLTFGPAAYLGVAGAALAADAAMLKLAVRLFDRDRLLTRWT
jgi:ABC-2 type transport system permease protein